MDYAPVLRGKCQFLFASSPEVSFLDHGAALLLVEAKVECVADGGAEFAKVFFVDFRIGRENYHLMAGVGEVMFDKMKTMLTV